MSWYRIEELRHTYAKGTYNAVQSGLSSVSNPSGGESSFDRNSSYHDLKVHISYACIYSRCSHPQCRRGKEKVSTPKPKLHHVSPMIGEITGDRCQTCQKEERNKSSLIRVLTLKSLDNSLIFSIFVSITVLLSCL